MMKKTPAWIAILFVLFLSGCSLSGSRENALFTYAKIESRKSEQLHTYDSPYTLYLKNADDTYTMFVFASPVQFSEGDGRYSLIDPTLVESSREGIAFENKANAVKTSFPDKADGAFRIERGETFLQRSAVAASGAERGGDVSHLGVHSGSGNYGERTACGDAAAHM